MSTMTDLAELRDWLKEELARHRQYAMFSNHAREAQSQAIGRFARWADAVEEAITRDIKGSTDAQDETQAAG